MLNTEKISVVILAKNAQDHIEECLGALTMFNEIVLLNNGCTDNTLSLAAKFPNVKIFTQEEFLGFGPMKRLAVSHASNDWILSIDSDEILQAKVIDEINSLNLEENTVVALSRLNFYGDDCIKACGWYPDFVWRIFNRNYTNFNGNMVHEEVVVPESANRIHIKDALKHYTTTGVESMIAKMNRYSTIAAEQKFKKGEKSGICKAIIHFVHTFNKDYFFRGGIKYGYKGFVISLINATSRFNRYMKLYELNKSCKQY